MELAAIDLALLIKELSPQISNSRVTNIYSMPDGSFILRLSLRDAKRDLRIVPSMCLFLASGVYESHAELSGFCQALRRRLRGLFILGISVVEGERIVTISLGLREERYRLVLELFPGGYIVLLGGGGEALLSYPSKRSGRREIRPGSPYSLPHPRRTVTDPEEATRALLQQDARLKVGVALGRELGLGRKYSGEVLARAGIDPAATLMSLGEDGVKKIAGALNSLRLDIDAPSPRIYIVDERCIPAPFRLESLGSAGEEEETSLNSAVARCYDYFLAKAEKERVSEERGELIKKIEEEIAQKSSMAGSLIKMAEEKRRLAETMFNHLHELESARRLLLGGGSHPIVRSVDWGRGEFTATIDGLDVSIRIREPISRQASSLYDEAKNVTRGVDSLRAEIERLRKEAERAASAGGARPTALMGVVERERRGAWFHSYRWSYTSSGRLMVAGRDASSNIRLLKRHLDPSDIVMHAEVKGSPVLVLKEGGDASEEELREAASFCASYSRAWREGLSSVSVYWVKPGQISFSPPPGTFLAKGSFIVKPPKNYITAELKLAIGARLGEPGGVVVGPQRYVSLNSDIYVVVVPGEEPAAEIAKKIDDMVRERTGEGLGRNELDAIIASIPYSKARIAVKE